MPPKQKAFDKQAENEAARARKAAEDVERQEAAAWSVGAKDSTRQRQEEEKEAQRRQKAAEKASLAAAEEAELSSIARSSKPKKKGKDDFDFLKAALATQPKTKAQKNAEKKKAEEDDRRTKENEAAEQREAKRRAEEAEIKRLAAKGIIMNHADALFVPLNNHLGDDEFEDVSGLDAAIDVLGIAGKADEHPERRQKAMYMAYSEAMLPQLKEDYPGLKLSQYKERLFEMWKTAPENPRNQVATGKSSAEAI